MIAPKKKGDTRTEQITGKNGKGQIFSVPRGMTEHAIIKVWGTWKTGGNLGLPLLRRVQNKKGNKTADAKGNAKRVHLKKATLEGDNTPSECAKQKEERIALNGNSPITSRGKKKAIS